MESESMWNGNFCEEKVKFFYQDCNLVVGVYNSFPITHFEYRHIS